MFRVTQLLTTSKACQQALVTFAIDINQQASVLRKKLEKLIWQLENNPDLSKNKRKKLEDEKEAIEKQLMGFESQLTLLAITKVVHKTHE